MNPCRKALLLALIGSLSGAAVQAAETRWALKPEACSGELETRNETPLIIDESEIRWFDTACAVVSSYKVKDSFFLQARCTAGGKVSTLPILLERNGERLRIGWNREPVRDMQRCSLEMSGLR